ncbi:MAG: Uma2 family endonuclease [Acidobacteriota bacterium]
MSGVVAELQPRETGLTLHLSPAVELTDQQFFELCQLNSDLRLERTAEGDIVVMPPAGGETSNRNLGISVQLYNWTKRDGTGTAFESSAGFKLPNGADRSPDAAWVSHERLAQLTPEEKRKFIPLCPDFVIELLSPSDSLAATKAKMAEYIENGARLGFLIHPDARRVYVYRPGVPIEELKNVNEVSADPELPGFTLELADVWEPNI